MSAFLRRNVVLLLALGLLVLMALAYAVTAASGPGAQQEAQRAGVQTEIQELLETGEAQRAERDDVLLGTRVQRVQDDREDITALAALALTWQDQESYNEARASVQRRYGLPEEGSFMTTFLPPAPVNVDSEGTEYPYIDAMGLNSRVDGIDLWVQEVEGTRYDYVVLVSVSATSADAQSFATDTSVMLLSTDGSGGLQNVRGYASGLEPVRRSN